MKIELKNIKQTADRSGDGPAFSATIFVDGAKVGHCFNGGYGGPTQIEPVELAKKINSYAATLPKIKTSSIEFEQTADYLIAEIMYKHQVSKRLKKELSDRVYYVNSKGAVCSTKKMPAATLAAWLNPKNRDRVVATINSDKILNLFPLRTSS